VAQRARPAPARGFRNLMEGTDWPLVGRDATCTAIVSALGEEPVRSVIIAGAAGVGRTRLAREAVAVATRDGRPVRWAVGTAAAARVPLGALAHLIPAVDVASDPLALLQRATAAVVGEAPGPPPVLAVDDVHLLDPLSITLLHQLAAGGAVPMVLTVRTDGGTPDPMAQLWKDGTATRLELQPLGRADTERLVTGVLRGELGIRTAERLWQLTQGNPLFLREVLEEGERSGRLRRARGLWRWDGPMIPSQRLVEIVLDHIGELDVAEWRALEVLATAEPLAVHQLVALSSAEAVAALERRGVVSDDVAGGHGLVRATHPVYTAVVRSRVSEATKRLVRDQLTSGEDDVARSPEKLLQRCLAMLDCDPPMGDAGLLIEGAWRAMSVPNVALAERLAGAAVEVGGGIEAYLALVEATRWSGEPGRSESLAAEAVRFVATDLHRARLATNRVLTLSCALGRPQEAADVLREAVATIRSDEGRSLLSAAGSMLAVLGGDPQAERTATATLAAAPPGSPARPLAAAVAAWSLAHAGQTERALVAAREGWAAARVTSPAVEPLLTRAVLALAEALALFLAGRLKELDRRTAAWLERSLKGPEWAGDALAALHRGWVALTRGRPGQGVRWLEEALSGLERHDPAGMRGWCCSLLAIACALSGDAGRAREVLEAAISSPRGLLPVFAPIAGLAQAHLAAAEGRTADAGTLVLDAAAQAAEQGQAGIQALLLHRAVRFGRAAEVADRLRELAVRLDAPLVVDLAAYARGVADGDGKGLEEVSRRLERAGALMFAADCATAAAVAHQRTGARRPAAEWTTRAHTLARACGLPQPAGVDSLPVTALTSREEEVARLAAQSLSNQVIAHRLFLSVRTVEAHLSHVYTKLGVTGRAELATFLTEGGTTSSDNRPALVGGE
jgi:DNA-binding CsgD family transcriptional regulator